MDKDSAAALLQEEGGAGDGLFGQPWQEGENERTISGQVVQAFAYTKLKPEGAKLQYAYRDVTKPELNVRLRVTMGIDGTEGAVAFVTLPLYIRTTTADGDKRDPETGKQIFRPLTATEQAEVTQKAQYRFNRIKRVLGFQQVFPASTDGDDIAIYAKQFETGQEFIGDLRVDRSGEARGYNAKNTLWWDSIAAPDDPCHDKKSRERGTTAIEEAREQIARANKRGSNPSPKLKAVPGVLN